MRYDDTRRIRRTGNSCDILLQGLHSTNRTQCEAPLVCSTLIFRIELRMHDTRAHTGARAVLVCSRNNNNNNLHIFANRIKLLFISNKMEGKYMSTTRISGLIKPFRRLYIAFPCIPPLARPLPPLCHPVKPFSGTRQWHIFPELGEGRLVAAKFPAVTATTVIMMMTQNALWKRTTLITTMNFGQQKKTKQKNADIMKTR